MDDPLDARYSAGEAWGPQRRPKARGRVEPSRWARAAAVGCLPGADVHALAASRRPKGAAGSASRVCALVWREQVTSRVNAIDEGLEMVHWSRAGRRLPQKARMCVACSSAVGDPAAQKHTQARLAGPRSCRMVRFQVRRRAQTPSFDPCGKAGLPPRVLCVSGSRALANRARPGVAGEQKRRRTRSPDAYPGSGPLAARGTPPNLYCLSQCAPCLCLPACTRVWQETHGSMRLHWMHGRRLAAACRCIPTVRGASCWRALAGCTRCPGTHIGRLATSTCTGQTGRQFTMCFPPDQC